MPTTIERNYYQILNYLLIAVIAVCFVHELVAFFTERSLWIDESMLMKSVVTRDFAGICHGFFDHNQSAPLGYMLVVKFFEVLFGNSPMSLRLFSLLQYFGTAVLVYLIARDGLKFRVPLLAVALIMGLWVTQYYGNEAKPYMGDIFFSFLAVWAYFRYLKGKMTIIIVSVIMALSVWFCFSAIFTMGGICAYHFIYNFIQASKKKKSWSEFIVSVWPLLIVGISVLLYFFLWTSPQSTNVPADSDDNYWVWLYFPIIPHCGSDLALIKTMWIRFSYLERIGVISYYFFMAGILLYFILRYKLWFTWAMVLNGLMVIMVSGLKMFPIEDRLLLGQYTILWLMVACSSDYVIGRIVKNPVTIILTTVFILFPIGYTIRDSFDFSSEAFHRSRHETKLCIDYINSVRKPTSHVYITPSGRPAAQYYLNYPDTLSLYERRIFDRGDYIWGGMFRQAQSESAYNYTIFIHDDEVRNNAQAIIKYEDVYILDIHAPWVHEHLLNELRRNGMKVQKEKEFYGTNVWHVMRPEGKIPKN